MKYTNNQGLPKSVTNLIEKIQNSYDKGISDYTPSSLIRPYYLARLEDYINNTPVEELKAKGMDELTVDYSSQLPPIEGQILHALLENSAEDSDLKETRVYRRFGLHLVGAQFDSAIVKDEILDDYKYSVSYKFKKNFDGTMTEIDDWETQVNIERYILTKGGWYRKAIGDFKEEPNYEQIPIQMDIKKVRIIGFIKDFSLADADRDPLYPQTRILSRGVPIWPDERVEQYVFDRIQGHESSKKSHYYEVPQCTKKEMWVTQVKWALMKRGNKKAVKLYPSKSEAEDRCIGDSKLFVEERPARRNRCLIHKNGESYCPVAHFCQHNLDNQQKYSELKSA